MKVILSVPDMECPNCAMHLEGLEDQIPGVTRISASYKKQKMEVEFNEALVTLEAIIKAANEIGYHPELK